MLVSLQVVLSDTANKNTRSIWYILIVKQNMSFLSELQI